MEKQPRIELQQYWQHQLQQWKASGLSGLHYCRQHDLSYSRFDYWKNKLSTQSQPQCSPAASSGFVQVVQCQEVPEHQERNHLHTHRQSDLTLTLPNGAILSGICSGHIDTVVQLLERI